MNYNYKQALNYPRVFEGNYIDIVLIVKINDGQYCIQGEDILIYSYLQQIYHSHKKGSSCKKQLERTGFLLFL